MISFLFEILSITITTTFCFFTFFIPFYGNFLYCAYCKLSSTFYELLGTEVFMCGDLFNPNNKSVILCNHKSYLDIMTMFYISAHYKTIIGFCLKKQVQYMPGHGWWCYRLGFPALQRNKDDIQKLQNRNCEFPLVIYPEGTRFTFKKHDESVGYAKKHGYEISKYAQLPKYKGAFALKSNIVYHMTLIYVDKNGNVMKNEITKRPAKIYYYVKAYYDVPKDENEYKLWIHKLFKNTDEYYDNFQPNNAIQLKSHCYSQDHYTMYTLFKMKISYSLFDYAVYTLVFGIFIAVLTSIYGF